MTSTDSKHYLIMLSNDKRSDEKQKRNRRHKGRLFSWLHYLRRSARKGRANNCENQRQSSRDREEIQPAPTHGHFQRNISLITRSAL